MGSFLLDKKKMKPVDCDLELQKVYQLDLRVEAIFLE